MKFTVSVEKPNLQFSHAGKTQSQAIKLAIQWAKEQGQSANVFIYTFNRKGELVYLNKSGRSDTPISWSLSQEITSET